MKTPLSVASFAFAKGFTPAEFSEWQRSLLYYTLPPCVKLFLPEIEQLRQAQLSLGGILEKPSRLTVDKRIQSGDWRSPISLDDPFVINLHGFYLLARRNIQQHDDARVEDGINTDFTGFIITSLDIHFPYFKQLWGQAVYNQRKLNPGVYDQLHSLFTRLETLLISLDNTVAECMLPGNNSTVSKTIYHLAYGILILYGIFEDFAWILAKISGFAGMRTSVGLRINRDTRTFFTALEQKQTKAWEFISTPAVQEFISYTFALRSTIVHRNFLQGYVLSQMGHNQLRNMIRIPAQTEPFFPKDYSAPEIVGSGLRVEPVDRWTLDPFIHCSFLFGFSEFFVNSLAQRFSVV